LVRHTLAALLPVPSDNRTMCVARRQGYTNFCAVPAERDMRASKFFVKTIREWCAALVVGKHNSVETVRPSRKLQCFVLATFGRNRGLVRFSRHPFLDRFNFRFDVVLCA
jgi:hypothetical protein